MIDRDFISVLQYIQTKEASVVLRTMKKTEQESLSVQYWEAAAGQDKSVLSRKEAPRAVDTNDRRTGFDQKTAQRKEVQLKRPNQ